MINSKKTFPYNRLVLLLIFQVFTMSTILAQETIQWTGIEKAVELKQSSANKKLIFVDIYTDWCGWCKKMDQTTFKDSAIVAYMSEHFYPAKLDAEQKADITIGGKTYKYVPNGKRGYHEVAAAILTGKMSYPSYAVLDENLQLVTIIQGYQKVEDLSIMLIYLSERKYLNQTYEEFKKSYKP